MAGWPGNSGSIPHQGAEISLLYQASRQTLGTALPHTQRVPQVKGMRHAADLIRHRDTPTHAFGHSHRRKYEGCPASIRPFWVSREPVAWPWYNLAASQRRPHCASVNSHYPVGLVSRQWDAVDWACVLCDRRIHSDRARRSASSRQCARPFYSSHAGFFFFGKTSNHPGLSAPLQPRFGTLRLRTFPKAKIAIEREEICEWDGHTVNKLSQRRLTADWLAPRESDCSRMHSKVSSDRLPSYTKTTRPVLEIFKMDGYFPDSPRILTLKSIRTPDLKS